MTALNSPVTSNDIIGKVNELDAREALPSQTGQGGKFLTTNGSNASWDSPFPTQTGNYGKVLKTNGVNVLWDTVDALPEQLGNADKILSTNGVTPFWLQKEYMRTLTSTQAAQIVLDGTYNGSLVSDGEVFIKDDGTFQQFSDTVGEPTLAWTSFNTGSQLFASDGTTLAYTNGGKVYKSTDTGATFTEVASGLPSYTPSSLYTSSKPFFYINNLWVILVSNVSGAYVSTDLVNWSLITFDFGEESIKPNVNYQTGFGYNGSVYAMAFRNSGNNQAIYTSTDFEHWTKSSHAPGMPSSSYKIVSKGTDFYYLSANGIYKSTDNCTTFSRVNNTYFDYGGNIWVKNNNVYAMLSSGGLRISSDDGATWTSKTSPVNGNTYTDLAYINGVYVLSKGGYPGNTYYTTDFDTWTTSSTFSGYSSALTVCEDNFVIDYGYRGVYSVSHTYALTDLSYNKTDVDTALSGKQATLIAGTGIDITGNVISATGGGGGSAGALTDIAIAGTGIEFEGGSSVNYTLYGSPTVDSNYVASDFSESDRILPTMVGFAGQTFANLAHSYPWEFKTKINLTTVGVWNAIFGGVAGSWGIDFYVDSSNRLAMNLSDNGTNYNFSGGEDNVHGTTTLSANTDYWLKCGWDGSKYYAELSTDGTTYTTGELSFISSTPIYNSSYDTYLGFRNQNYLHGSMSLPDTSFSFNDGQFEWNVVETGKTIISTSLENIAIAGDGIKFVYGSTENFTTTGSVIVTDGIATNLAGGSINTGIAFMPGNNPWEIHMKVKTAGTLSGDKWFSQSSPNYYASPLFGTSGNKMYALITGDGSTWNILSSTTGSTSLSTNTWYYIRLKFTGTQYIYSYSLDDSTWHDEITKTSSLSIFQQNTNKLLFTGGDNLNSIDLNETYIKVNDVIVWQAFGDISTIPFIKSDIGSGASAPTSSTEGYVGKLYITSGGAVYICTGVSGSTYTWKQITVS